MVLNYVVVTSSPHPQTNKLTRSTGIPGPRAACYSLPSLDLDYGEQVLLVMLVSICSLFGISAVFFVTSGWGCFVVSSHNSRTSRTYISQDKATSSGNLDLETAVVNLTS